MYEKITKSFMGIGKRKVPFILQSFDIRIQTSEFRLQSSDFKVQSSEFRLQTSDI